MSDEKLLHELRNSKGWPTLGNAAAYRIEELKAKLVATAIDCNDRYAELEDRLDAARQDAREAEAYAGEWEAALAQAIDLIVRIISDPHWRTSDNALWKDLCNFRRVTLAELKGQDDE